MTEYSLHEQFDIILADDDEDEIELFKEALTTIGEKISVHAEPDGTHLMNFLSACDILPKVIFLDLNMPRKNGIECLTEIRSEKKFDNIPVIIYSTSCSPQEIERTFEKGATLYVHKPESFEKLKSIIKYILSINWQDFLPKRKKENFLYK